MVVVLYKWLEYVVMVIIFWLSGFSTTINNGFSTNRSWVRIIVVMVHIVVDSGQKVHYSGLYIWVNYNISLT
jgi:hypothetical protein